ncbi:MAG: LptF/LptG family permease, partial [Sedimentisphaerales bacterium]|nr:LptF/LptG family permease [Sedimentisphaerales bacterium]
YLDLRQPDHYLRIYAHGCGIRPATTPSANLIGIGAEPVEMAWFRNSADRPDRIYRSRKTRLTLTTLAAQPLGRLVLEDVQWNYTDDDHLFNLANYDFTGITLDDKIVRSAGNLSLSGDVLQGNIPLRHAKPSAKLRQQYKTLKEECKELAAEIIAEKHSRLAFGVCCVSLVLMGAALGIIFRSGHLLTAFGISFVPAALCLITIFTGKHIAEQNPENIALGIAFLWSGIVVVTGVTVTIYKSLLKH